MALHLYIHDERPRRRRRRKPRDVAAFEPAKHPRGKGGHFLPGGGESSAGGEPNIALGKKMPISTGVPPKHRDACTCDRCRRK